MILFLKRFIYISSAQKIIPPGLKQRCGLDPEQKS